MSDDSKIEWTDATWNPVTGCTKVSPGCDHCYAETFAERFRGTPGHHFEQGFDVTLRPERLDIPWRWRRPRRVFVNSMSDLFHDAVPDEFIARVFAVMALAPQHTFQLLTKRHARMRSLLSSREWPHLFETAWQNEPGPEGYGDIEPPDLPLPNVWLGVSVENQQWADIRIPALLDTPAAVRFLSCEPLLGPVDLTSIGTGPVFDGTTEKVSPGFDARFSVDWVIVGGESGHGARPMHPNWARLIRDQCRSAGVPFLFKQWGEWALRCTLALCGVACTCSGNGGGHPATMTRVGKKNAGRELDGRTWDEFPQAVTG